MNLKKLIPRPARAAAKKMMRRSVGLFDSGRVAFSQEGEDLVIARLLGVEEGRGPGFYVDVGAHDPERYSNTMFFYQRGWRGINIDPAAGIASKFLKARPRDITLEVAVSDCPGEIEYVIFNEPALNGCDRQVADLRNGRNGHKVKQIVTVKTMRLSDILAEHLPLNTPIDFISVDVEGHDLEVLQSNEWQHFRPKLVLAEDMNVASLADVASSNVTGFLEKQGYIAVGKCALTIIYAEEHCVHNTELGMRVR